MKVKIISYSKVFSLGNYENEKIGVDIELQDNDDVQKAIQEARNFVEFNHKVNGLVNEMSQCERVVNNPDEFTGAQVKRAMERMQQIQEQLSSGSKFLSQSTTE
jgi:predicted membrane chloride channel (bestrophin family)